MEQVNNVIENRSLFARKIELAQTGLKGKFGENPTRSRHCKREESFFTAHAIHCPSWNRGKEKKGDDPQARRPACFCVALVSFGSKEKVIFGVMLFKRLLFLVRARKNRRFSLFCIRNA